MEREILNMIKLYLFLDMESEDDQDLHLCIRCRCSFAGLETYVAHRKGGCEKQTKESFGSSLECNAIQSIGDNTLNSITKKVPGSSFNSSSQDKPIDEFSVEVFNLQSDNSNTNANVINTPDTFTKYYDPLFNNNATVSSFFKSIETFNGNSSKSSPSSGESRDAFTNKEEQNFYGKYSDPCLNSHSSEQILSQNQSENIHSEKTSRLYSNINQTQDKIINDFLSDGNLENIEQNNYFLNQDNFLSSLELMSSGKIMSERQKCGFDDEDQENLDTIPIEIENQENLHIENNDTGMEKHDAAKGDFLSSLELSSVKVSSTRECFEMENSQDKTNDAFIESYARNDLNSKQDSESAVSSVATIVDNVQEGEQASGFIELSTENLQSRKMNSNQDSESVISRVATIIDEVQDVEQASEFSTENFRSIKMNSKHLSKGKWLPGKKPHGYLASEEHHECIPCNAQFATKASFKRHLDSKLHSKNVEVDNTQLTENLSARGKKIEAKNFLKETIASLKRKKCDPKLIQKSSDNEDQSFGLATQSSSVESNYPSITVIHDDSESELPDQPKKKIRRALVKMKCPVCKVSFAEAHLALHFGSLAHIHNELEYKSYILATEVNLHDKFVLDNSEKLIRSCIFECSSCDFYCNSHDDLFNHVKTHNVNDDDSSLAWKYSCSACSFKSLVTSSNELTRHLQTFEHLSSVHEYILLAHKVSIKITLLFQCLPCRKIFKLRRQCEDHKRNWHVEEKPVKRSSYHFSRLCPKCPYQDSTCRNVRIHMREVHGAVPPYTCFLCGTIHDSSESAKKHRHSREHRINDGREEHGKKRCQFCYDEFDNLYSLLEHINTIHKSHCIPCMKCGLTFPISSEQKLHSKICSGEPVQNSMNEGFNCELCHFSNPLLAHVQTHQVLIHSDNSNGSYECIVCKVRSLYTVYALSFFFLAS